MRATDGLQTTINLGPIHRDDQALSLQLSLGMSLPVPSQDEHLPDQIRRSSIRPAFRSSTGSSEPSSRRPTRSWSCRTAAAKPAPVSGAGGRGRSPSRRPSARSPSSGRGSATSTTAPSRSPQPGPGRHPTNCTSPGTSGMRSVISSAIDPRARAVPRSAATPGMRTCWGSARSSTSCIRRASNWSARNVERPRAILDGAPRPSWPPSAPPSPTPRPSPGWSMTTRRGTTRRQPVPSGSRPVPSRSPPASPGVSRLAR